MRQFFRSTSLASAWPFLGSLMLTLTLTLPDKWLILLVSTYWSQPLVRARYQAVMGVRNSASLLSGQSAKSRSTRHVNVLADMQSLSSGALIHPNTSLQKNEKYSHMIHLFILAVPQSQRQL